jgi:hypothetical protein
MIVVRYRIMLKYSMLTSMVKLLRQFVCHSYKMA